MDERSAPPPPSFLAPAYPVQDLEQAESSIAVIQPEGDILWVNRYWRRFAAENGGGPWPEGVRSYFDGIAPPLRAYYRAVFANVLATGEVFEQDYECSSADDSRFFHLRVHPIERRALLLEHSLMATFPHPVEQSDEVRVPDYLGPAGFILQCSNCRRVRRHGTRAWDWVPALVATTATNVSHGICHACVGFYWGGARRARER